MRYILPFLFLLACSNPKKQESKPTLSARLDEFFTRQVPPDGPGGVLLVVRDTSVIYSKAIGLADLNTREPITTKTLFNIGSISKTFVANGILLLQQQGKLSVEDNIAKYFPAFKNRSIASKVKIKHLLTHTSGLPDNRPVSRDSVFYLTANDEQNWYPVTQTDVLEFEPGTRYHYSNPSFNGLALIVEKVSGQPWRKFISDNIFLPSGMNTSTITDGAHPDKGVSHGYSMIGGVWKEDDYGEEPTFCAAGNGGVWSSVEELAKYEIAIRNNTFLTPETISDSRTVKNFGSWADSIAADHGWSWQIQKSSKGYLTAEHTGHQGGFAANYISIPEKKIFFVVLYNAPYDVFQLREKVLEILEADGLM